MTPFADGGTASAPTRSPTAAELPHPAGRSETSSEGNSRAHVKNDRPDMLHPGGFADFGRDAVLDVRYLGSNSP